MRTSLTALLIIILLPCAAPVLADSCYDLKNNRNFDCNSQTEQSENKTPASPARPTGLREQLQRRLAEPAERTGPTQAELKERIDEAAKPVNAALEHRDAPDAQQRYNEAMAGFRKATEEAAAAAKSPAVRAALTAYGAALGRLFDEQARMQLNPATGVPPPQA